jgi:predicted nuclease with TOPRIM domain
MTDEEKTTNMEERIAKIEGILEQINERLNHFGAEMGDLRKEMNGKFMQIDGRFGQLNEENRADHHHIETDIKTNFRWTVGIILTMWVTVIIAVLFA